MDISVDKKNCGCVYRLLAEVDVARYICTTLWDYNYYLKATIISGYLI